MYDVISMPNKLLARVGTSDEGTWHDVFDEDKAYHRAPLFKRDLEVILDLGSYTGYTTYDFLEHHRKATIYAIEPDPQNFDMMHVNLYGINRVYATNGGIANFNGTCSMIGDHFNAKQLYPYPGDTDVYTLDSFIGSLEKIDYIKFDIEGAEQVVFSQKDARWPTITTCVKVETHYNYSNEHCIKDLKELGYETWLDDKHEHCVVGMNHKLL